MARTMREAVSEEDYSRWDKGQRASKKTPRFHPEPKPPKVDGKIIRLDKINLADIKVISKGRRKNVRNEDGVTFIGYEVAYQVEDGKTVEGWMSEADYVEMRRLLFREGKINVDELEY